MKRLLSSFAANGKAGELMTLFRELGVGVAPQIGQFCQETLYDGGGVFGFHWEAL